MKDKPKNGPGLHGPDYTCDPIHAIESTRLTTRPAGVHFRQHHSRHAVALRGASMKSYARLAIALVVPLLMTVAARRAQIAAPPAEAQRGTATGATGQAAEARPRQEPPPPRRPRAATTHGARPT